MSPLLTAHLLMLLEIVRETRLAVLAGLRAAEPLFAGLRAPGTCDAVRLTRCARRRGLSGMSSHFTARIPDLNLTRMLPPPAGQSDLWGRDGTHRRHP